MSKIVRNLRLATRRYYSSEVAHHGHHKTPLEIAVEAKATMNHLPQPSGAWKDLNAKRLQSANLTLYSGLALFLISLVVVSILSFIFQKN